VKAVTSASRLETYREQNVIEAVSAILSKSLSIWVESAEEDLLAAGLLDSLNLVRLVSQIEERFDLELPIGDVDLESFRSVSAIAEMVERRRTVAEPVQGGSAVSGAEPQFAAEIRTLLEEKLSIRVDDMATDLFQSGHLDSMSLVQLILELESHFGLTLPMEDLELAAFRSVISIADLIERRKRVGA
jgi:acyl carrier protein